MEKERSRYGMHVVVRRFTEGKSVKFFELHQCRSGFPVHKTSYPAPSSSSREVERATNNLSGELRLGLSLAVNTPGPEHSLGRSWPTFQMLEALAGYELPSDLHV